jgi:hypothetical protein
MRILARRHTHTYSHTHTLMQRESVDLYYVAAVFSQTWYAPSCVCVCVSIGGQLRVSGYQLGVKKC